MKSMVLSIASTLAAVAMFACSSTNGGSTSGAAVSSVDVSPDPCGVSHTGSQQLSAQATFADGTKTDITKSSDITWTSSNTSLATVDTDGNVVGVSGGIATITASYEGKTGSTSCLIAP